MKEQKWHAVPDPSEVEPALAEGAHCVEPSDTMSLIFSKILLGSGG